MYQEIPFTAVSAHRRNGLILCKTFHAEFVGPGAAVGRPSDFDCHTVIAIGKQSSETTALNTLEELITLEERQDAYRRRIQWMNWLRKLTDQQHPKARAEALLASFDAFFEPETVATLPVEVLALLIGVLPRTMEQVLQQHYAHLGDSCGGHASLPCGWKYISVPHLMAPQTVTTTPTVTPALGLGAASGGVAGVTAAVYPGMTLPGSIASAKIPSASGFSPGSVGPLSSPAAHFPWSTVASGLALGGVASLGTRY